MIKNVVILLILALAIHAQMSDQRVALQILHVSESPSEIVRPAKVSLRGGRLIYIKAIGHSTMAEKIQVFVGAFPCKLPADGVTDTFISCETTDSKSTSDIKNNRVTIVSDGISVTSSSTDVVDYLGTVTSTLDNIFPTSNFGGQFQNFFGIHKQNTLGDGRDMGDVRALNLGE